ncbi:MAG: hypothetical protein HC939_01615 [Pleurocapsa sp. SU_5_0]|nr:hypothetical protein [Pleurocapsa sp. SU_5_0]NJR44681.1 hypothetical protein [Hyellaceae cyanobacterium CSU_1_1]
MFGKSPREPQKPNLSDLKDIKLSPPTSTPVDLTSPQDTLLQTSEIEDKQLVSTVERISRIVSPYFIAIVGLALYENNFLIGTILILVGILSLLKVSTNDVGNFLEWLKNFLGLK